MNDAGILIHGLFMSVVIRPLRMPSLNGIPIQQGSRVQGSRWRTIAKTFQLKMSYVRSCDVVSQQCP